MAVETNQSQTPDLLPDAPVADTEAVRVASPETEAAPPAAASPETAKSQSKPPEYVDEARNAIYARARESRAREAQTPFGDDINDPDLNFGANRAIPLDVAPSSLEQQALDAEQRHMRTIAQAPNGAGYDANEQFADPQQPRVREYGDPSLQQERIKVIINGEPRVVTLQEALANYQMNSAGRDFLDQAKALLSATKSFVRNQPTSGADSGLGDDPRNRSQSQSAAAGDTSQAQDLDTGLADIAERIQLGDKEDAAKALRQLVDHVRSSASGPSVDAQQILSVLEDRNTEDAVRTFVTKTNLTDPTMGMIVKQNAEREMLQDLLNAGFTQQDLAENIKSPQHLAAAHKAARINRLPGVRDHATILQAGYNAAQQWRTGAAAPPASNQQNGGNGQQLSQQRQQRLASVPQQPANRRQTPGYAPPPPSRDQRIANAVQAMRQSRGQ